MQNEKALLIKNLGQKIDTNKTHLQRLVAKRDNLETQIENLEAKIKNQASALEQQM